MRIVSAYKKLICSPTQLAACRHIASVSQLLQQLNDLWGNDLTDDQLLSELMLCNQQVQDIDPVALSGHWLPHRYQAKHRSINWCLPQGHATEPFHDQYIERCRRLLLNQLIAPRTPLQPLLNGAAITSDIQPAGFIFHLSRCGSTLVSGCLAELHNTHVLSESQLLTEILLDDSLSETEKQHLLPQLIRLQTAIFPGRDKVIVKWNAWDIFFWPLIRKVYPQVPVIFLTRNPVEILASHQRSAGRHMSGDKSMARLNPAFLMADTEKNILDMRINILSQLMSGMLAVNKGEVRVVDYTQLNAEKILEIAHFFGAAVTADEYKRIEQRMSVHSKDPHRSFTDDTRQKRQLFSAAETDKINHHLHNGYQALARGIEQRDLDYAL